MNNLPESNTHPAVQQPSVSPTPPAAPQAPAQPSNYYRPPSYYTYPVANGQGTAPTGYYEKKPGYIDAVKETLSNMNLPLFLIISVIFGWVCARTIMTGHIGVGMTVMGVLFYAFYLPFMLHKQHKKLSVPALLLFIPQIAVLASFTLYCSPLNRTVALLLSFALLAVQTTLISGCTESKPFSRQLLVDAGASYLAYPFLNLAETAKAIVGMGKNAKDGKKDGNGMKVLIGLVISIPVVIVLIILLCRADQMFAVWVDTVIRMLNINFLRIFSDVILTILAMLYVMPLVASLRSGYHNPANESTLNRPLDAIITSTVLYAASLIYIVFVAVQFRYLFASGGKLPMGYTYAGYCRRGFFELVFVTALTAIVIAVVCMLTKHNDKDKLPTYTKVALLLISACSLVMMVSAAYRLVIYVREYGMTVSRFNAGIVIAFIAVCVVVMMLKILFEQLKVSAVIGSVLIILLAAYTIFNVDGFVAGYNVDRSLNGSSKEIDVDYIRYNLSPAAIPELDRLARTARNSNIRSDAEGGIITICNYYNLCNDYNPHLASWTLDRANANEIVKVYRKKYNKILYN